MPRGFQAQPGQRSLVQNGFNAALGLEERNRRDRRPAQVSRELLRDDGRQNGMFGAGREVEPMVSAPAGVSILGAGKTTVLVRVANLAYGTTAEDVVVSRLLLRFSCACLISIVGIRTTSYSERHNLIAPIGIPCIGRPRTRDCARSKRIDQ